MLMGDQHPCDRTLCVLRFARFGQFALCKDDQGSSFGLHQPPR
jgi:hypothetical protein